MQGDYVPTAGLCSAMVAKQMRIIMHKMCCTKSDSMKSASKCSNHTKCGRKMEGVQCGIRMRHASKTIAVASSDRTGGPADVIGASVSRAAQD